MNPPNDHPAADDAPTVTLPEQSTSPAARPQRRARRLIAADVALTIALAAAGAVAYTLRGGVPDGVTVLGLDLGGKPGAGDEGPASAPRRRPPQE